MKVLRWLALIIAVPVVFALLVACGGNGSDDVADTADGQETGDRTVVSWATWGNEGELDRFFQLNEEFEREFPEIEIDFMPFPNDGYDQRIVTMVAAGTEPDVFYIEHSFGVLALNGNLEPLDDFLYNDPNISAEDFFQNLLDNCRINGVLYALPCDCAPTALYYNQTMFEELGLPSPNELEETGDWDVHAFRDMAVAITESGRTAYILEDWWSFQFDWIGSSAGNMYPGDGRTVMVNTPESIAIYEFLQDMTLNHYIVTTGNPAQVFMSGELGFVRAGRWLMPVFRDITDFEFDIAPIPRGLNGGRMVALPSVPVAMSSNSDVKEAAWEFMAYFHGREGQTFRLANTGNCIPSINLPGLDDVVFLNEPVPANSQIWYQGRAEGYTIYIQNILHPETLSLWDDANDAILIGGADVTTTLNALAESINAILAESTLLP